MRLIFHRQYQIKTENSHCKFLPHRQILWRARGGHGDISLHKTHRKINRSIHIHTTVTIARWHPSDVRVSCIPSHIHKFSMAPPCITLSCDRSGALSPHSLRILHVGGRGRWEVSLTSRTGEQRAPGWDCWEVFHTGGDATTEPVGRVGY